MKEAAPFIGLPPPNMNLTGWRDPFVVERPCEHNNYEWVVLMGSGGSQDEAALCCLHLGGMRFGDRAVAVMQYAYLLPWSLCFANGEDVLARFDCILTHPV